MASLNRQRSDTNVTASDVELSEDVQAHDGTASQSELAPADGGRQARLNLLACALLQFPIWG